MDRVLIADDDVQLLTILTESLEKYKGKFEIVAAKNGLEAILALQKQTFSMVITEIRMPKVNGPSSTIISSKTGSSTGKTRFTVSTFR